MSDHPWHSADLSGRPAEPPLYTASLVSRPGDALSSSERPKDRVASQRDEACRRTEGQLVHHELPGTREEGALRRNDDLGYAGREARRTDLIKARYYYFIPAFLANHDIGTHTQSR